MANCLVGLDLSYSKAIKTLRMLAVADLPLTKPAWAGWIRRGIRLASLVAIILDIILASRFNSEIGWYDPGCVLSLFFGE